MHNIDDCAAIRLSPDFDRVLHQELVWAEERIIALFVRIASNPYAEDLVAKCQRRPPDDRESFYYRSPVGFEVYWDVELERPHCTRVADMAIIPTVLRAAFPLPLGYWLMPGIY